MAPSSDRAADSPDAVQSPRSTVQGAYPFPRQDLQPQTPDRRNSRRKSSNASVSSVGTTNTSIGGSLDIRPLRTDHAVKDSAHNAISNLLQAPIVRTGLLPQNASAAPGYKAPSTRDIPPVTLTNIPHVDPSAFKDYLTRVTPLFESITRRREEAAKAEAAENEPTTPSVPGTPIGEWPKRPSFPSTLSSASLSTIAEGTPTRRRRANEPAPLSTVPTVYFDDDFHLENPRTFDVVSERADVVRPADGSAEQNGRGQPPRKALASNAILQEKLSWYMDTVEVHLINSISTASSSFFTALGSLRSLQEEAAESAARIQKLRSDLIELDKGMALGGLEIAKMRQRRKNIGRLTQATEQIHRVVDKVVQCEELVDDGKFEEAADGIDATALLIAGQTEGTDSEDSELIDLRSLKAFHGLFEGLEDLQIRIGRGFQTRFISALLQDMRAHVQAVPANNTVRRWATSMQRRGEPKLFQGTPKYLEVGTAFRNALAAELAGLERTHHTSQAADAFREAITREVKTLIRKHLPSSSDDDAESMTSNATRGGRAMSQQDKSAILARNLRALDEQDAEALIIGICTNVSEVLRRLGTQIKVLLDITSSSDGRRSRTASPERASPSNAPTSATTIDGRLAAPNGVLSPPPRRSSLSPAPSPREDIVQALDMSSLLGQAVEVAHTQISRILKVRAEQTHKLPFQRFIRYFTIIRLFADECEAISGFSGQALKGILNTQLAAAVAHKADTDSQKIAQKLEGETWEAQDFQDKDQVLLSRILDGMNSDPAIWTVGTRVWEDYTANGEVTTAQTNGKPAEPKSAKTTAKPAYIDETKFILVSAATSVLPIIDSFLSLIASVPHVSPSAVPALMEVLRAFNSRSSQLILGAGATRVSGLKNITTKHLALSSQALSFIVALVPYIREAVRRHVGGRTEILAEFDKTKRLFQDHQMGIHDKLVEIMSARAKAHKSAMDKIDFDKQTAAGPSPYMDVLTRETGTLHRVLARHLQEGDVMSIMSQIAKAYRDIWIRAFAEVKVSTQEGRARLLRDVELFDSRLSKIEGFDDIAKALLDNLMARSIAADNEAKRSLELSAAKAAAQKPATQPPVEQKAESAIVEQKPEIPENAPIQTETTPDQTEAAATTAEAITDDNVPAQEKSSTPTVDDGTSTDIPVKENDAAVASEVKGTSAQPEEPTDAHKEAQKPELPTRDTPAPAPAKRLPDADVLFDADEPEEETVEEETTSAQPEPEAATAHEEQKEDVTDAEDTPAQATREVAETNGTESGSGDFVQKAE